MQLAAVWHACHALQGQFATRRARAWKRTQTRFRRWAQEDHAEFRARFVQAHPDVILLDAKEPHKKFVEKLSRDFLVHGMVPYYSVAEIRTRSDSIVQKSGLSKNAEDLLTISKADEPDQVTDSMTMMNRIHAFFMPVEYLNICTYSRAAGPLRYMQELEQFRSECPGLPYLLAADSLIRKKVNRLQAEQRPIVWHVRGRHHRGPEQPQVPLERRPNQGSSFQSRSAQRGSQRDRRLARQGRRGGAQEFSQQGAEEAPAAPQQGAPSRSKGFQSQERSS